MSFKNKLKLHPELNALLTEPLFMTREALMATISENQFSDAGAYYDEAPPTYQDHSVALAKELSTDDISLTTSFNETDIPDNSIALHRIKGVILAERTWWWFSTQQFIEDLRAAERNPQIIAHLVFINSGGGEAWYLEKALQAEQDLSKPVITFIERRCCSAGYYIGCGGNKIFTSTINDTIGSIGVMVSFFNIIPYYKKLGIQHIEEYATQSTKKNKRFNDLLDGKSKKFKEKELDPLAQQFIDAVRGARGSLAALPEKHDVFAGETYHSEESRTVGLTDEIADLEVALQYTLEQGKSWKEKAEQRNRMQTYID